MRLYEMQVDPTCSDNHFGWDRVNKIFKAAFCHVQVTTFICTDTKELGHQEHFLLAHCPQTSVLPHIIQCAWAVKSKASGMESDLVIRHRQKEHPIIPNHARAMLIWTRWSLRRVFVVEFIMRQFRWFHLWLTFRLTFNKLLIFPCFSWVQGFLNCSALHILVLPWRKELIEINLELF